MPEVDSSENGPIDSYQWQQWINEINARDSIYQEQTTKSGKKQTVNLRDRLFELELKPENGSQESGVRGQENKAQDTGHGVQDISSVQNSQFLIQNSQFTPSPSPSLPSSPFATLRYIGSCRNDGTLLRPDQVVYMLEQVANREFQLLKVHRDRLVIDS